MSNLALKLVEGTKEDRDHYIDRVDVLAKVKQIVMLPDNEFIQPNDMASYYEVSVDLLRITKNRHKLEFESDGVIMLKGADLQNYKRKFQSYQNVTIKTNAQITLYTRRAALRMGMLLTESNVADKVRDYLLNVEEIASIEQKEKAIKYTGIWTKTHEDYILGYVHNNSLKGIGVYKSFTEIAEKMGTNHSTIQSKWYLKAYGKDSLKDIFNDKTKLFNRMSTKKEKDTLVSVEQNNDILTDIQQMFKINRIDIKGFMEGISKEFDELSNSINNEIEQLKESNDKLHKKIGIIWRSQQDSLEKQQEIIKAVEQINSDVVTIKNTTVGQQDTELTSLQHKVKVLNTKVKTQQKENEELLKFIGKSSFMGDKLVESDIDPTLDHLKFKMDRNGNLNKM